MRVEVNPRPILFGLMLVLPITLAAAAVISELAPLPVAGAAPSGITKAANGTIWFTEKSANRVASLSAVGVLTEYAVPTVSSSPERISRHC